jgi:hypothetical protein
LPGGVARTEFFAAGQQKGRLICSANVSSSLAVNSASASLIFAGQLSPTPKAAMLGASIVDVMATLRQDVISQARFDPSTHGVPSFYA